MEIKLDNTKITIAVIDDDEAARLSIGQMFQLRKYKVKVFSSAEATLAWSGLANVDCIVTDVKMPGMDGEEFLDEFKRRGYEIPIIMITGHGDISMAVRCLKDGAYDFVEKPFEDDFLLASVRRAVEKVALQRESKELKKKLQRFSLDEDGFQGMIGKSRVMQDVYEQIQVVAKSDYPALIYGETGTGKELAARAIHDCSIRKDGPFIAVNAGALPENMMESELFGHAKGAFTSADSKRDGKLIMASGGSLLLDEVESISISAQIKLLRVLEDGLVYPLGKDSPVKVDIRLIATTKIDLRELVKKGEMREDFYHRIMVLPIKIPSLRSRAEDIPLLISYFLSNSAKRSGIPNTKDSR